MHKSSCGNFFIFLDVYLGVKFLGHIVSVCLILFETDKLFPKVIALFYTFTSSMKVPVAPYPHQYLA